MGLVRRLAPAFRVLCLLALLLVTPAAPLPALAQGTTSSGPPPSAAPTPGPTGRPAAPPPTRQPMPLMFVENVGQFDPGARFQVQTRGATINLADDAIWLTVLDHSSAQPTPTPGSSGKALLPLPKGKLQSVPRKGVNLKLSFVGANPHPQIEPFDRLPTHVSYFQGNDPAKWHPDVPVYGGIRYKDLYPGINLEVTSTGGSWSWRMVPDGAGSATPPTVALRAEGASKVATDKNNFVMNTDVGDVAIPLIDNVGALTAPTSSIQDGNITSPFRSDVEAYTIATQQTGATSSSGLLFSTFLGGSSYDYSYGIAVDASGNAYVTGSTFSTDFPTSPGVFQTACGACSSASDTIVAKLNPAGMGLLYSTYLGGGNADEGYGIAVDTSGDASVTGYTTSTDFPTTMGAFQPTNKGFDAFVAKLNSTGTALLYSTFLGGSGADYGKGIAVDASGNAYVTGYTDASNFPVTAGAFQFTCGGSCAADEAFVAKLNPTGTALLYATYLGGSNGDFGFAIAVDTSGNAYITGGTQSADFPTTVGTIKTTCNGCSTYTPDAFAAKLNPTGTALVYSTYIGGTDTDEGRAIAIDTSGNVFITGYTTSTDFPTTPGALQTTCNGCISYEDAFVAKLNPTGTALLYATYLGGSSDDFGIGMAIDPNGNAYVTGRTISADFPTTSGAVQTSCGSCLYNADDAFVAKLNTTGSAMLYSTYLGGSSPDLATGIAMDTNGNAYTTGYTYSEDFPLTSGAYQAGCTSCGIGYPDAFVTKLAMGGSASTSSLSVSITAPASLSVVNGDYSPNPFTVTAAVTNTGSTTVSGVQLALSLPSGLSLASGSATQSVGDLAPNQTGQVTWSVQAANQSSATTLTYSVTASGSGVQSASASAQIYVPPMTNSPLAITAITYQHQHYPDGGWVSVPASGTVDGNLVKVRVTIVNTGSSDQAVDVQLLDDDSDQLLPGGDLGTFTIPAGQTVTVPANGFVWDTSGWAWYDQVGFARSSVKVRAALYEGTAEVATFLQPIVVAPKPLVMVHGWTSNATAWNSYIGPQGFLAQNNPLWHGYAVDLDLGVWSDPTPSGTIENNGPTLAAFIQNVRSQDNAWHVDLLAHSMGGLVSRYYIQNLMPSDAPDGRSVVSHLLMLGTPNLGSKCADALEVNKSWFSYPSSLWHWGVPPEPITHELTVSYVTNNFDPKTTNQRGVPFSILAGNEVPVTCLQGVGDEVVTVNSAEDAALSWSNKLEYFILHTQMPDASDVFSVFVLPQLALGPAEVARQAAAEPLPSVTRAAATASPSEQYLLTSFPQIPASGTTDVPIAVPSSTSFGVVLSAPPTVTSTLIDPNGAVTTIALAGSSAASQPVQSVQISNPAVGNWTLRLTNTVATATSALVTVSVQGTPTTLFLSVGSPNARAQVPIITTFSNNGAPVTGARVEVQLVGSKSTTPITLNLYDDGQHDDGQANDGVYGVVTGSLAPDDYEVIAQGNALGTTRLTLGSVQVTATGHTVYLPFVSVSR